MKYKILVFTIFSIFILQAQNTVKQIEVLESSLFKTLQNKNITTYLVAQQYCFGTTKMEVIDGKRKFTQGDYVETYVIWNDNEVDYIQKLDNFGFFEPLPLSDTTLSKWFIFEMPALIDDEVKPYKSASFTGNPAEQAAVQPCKRSFLLVDGLKRVEKSFSLFDISEKEEGDNLNFNFNQSLQIVQLNYQIEKTIKSLTFKRISN